MGPRPTRSSKRCLGAQGGSPTLQLEMARAHARAGRNAEAIAALEAAVRLDGRLADGWRELAALRFKTGDVPGGDKAYAEYSRLATPPPELTDAAMAIGNRRLDAAEAMLERHLKNNPEDVIALRMLASVASRRNDSLTAERLLMRCLELAPGYADARYDLASELYLQQRHAEVLPMVERLLASYPDEPNYMGLKSQALRLYGRVDEALALMHQAVAASPGNAKLRLLLGYLLREVGQQAAAVASYRQALALQPSLGEAYWSLADLKTVRFTEADRQAMQQQLDLSAPLAPNRISLEFALAKALEDEGEYEQSFQHYANANGLQRARVFHDPQVIHDTVERSRALFQPAFFSTRNGWGSDRIDPIFIVGMPRSGSTLLEQILASHSQVEGTRELPEVPVIVRELILKTSGESADNYPGMLANLTRADFEQLGAQYLERTLAHRPLGRPRFVDKLLGNFMHVGLIHLMFPRATIIDARRHPLACSFSCFKQLFVRGLYFTYDQEELALYYRDYVSSWITSIPCSPAGCCVCTTSSWWRSGGRGHAPAGALQAALRGGVPALL